MGVRSCLVLLLPLAACTGRIGSSSGTPGGPPTQTQNGRYVCNDRIHAAVTQARRLTPVEYQNAVTAVFDGRLTPSTRYPGPAGKSVTGFSTEPILNDIGSGGAEQLMFAAEDVALQLPAALAQLLPCSTSTPGETCVNTFIDKYGTRAYRRPLSTDERNELLDEYRAGVASGASFSDAMAMVVDHFLQLPQFLYLAEAAAGPVRALDGYELASRLSFMLTDSIPDDALLAAAPTLTDPATLGAQAARLLASPTANTAIARFFREWTATTEVAPADKDPTVFPFFNAAYAQSMNDSFDRFVVDQVRNGGTLRSLLRSTDAFVDGTMASFFGVTAPPAGQWAKVTLDATRYTGVVTQPAMLASLAHSTESSFIFRGKFIRKQLLCEQLGTPPPNAQSTFNTLPMPPNPTGKDVSAAIVARPECSGCHALINPAGLSFEQFDALGRWRTTYASGKTIDPSGVLPLVGATGHDLPFTDQISMMEQLTKEPQVSTCVATQVFRFTFSRTETSADACAIQGIGDALGGSGGTLGQAILAVTATDAFTHRSDQ
jgi:Protein of unknown function (DUF1592)/Protein of unknown function (DUF1588)/Protein of unknown function (DUF1595)/Protein of unknown function (DUF1585)